MRICCFITGSFFFWFDCRSELIKNILFCTGYSPPHHNSPYLCFFSPPVFFSCQRIIINSGAHVGNNYHPRGTRGIKTRWFVTKACEAAVTVHNRRRSRQLNDRGVTHREACTRTPLTTGNPEGLRQL